MKITRSSDWRDVLAFDVAVRADEVLPGDDARCAVCGPASPRVPRAQLWVLKQRHPHNPAGTVRLLCDAHRPAAPVASPARAAARPARSRRTTRTSPARTPSTRTPPRPERVTAVCPDCFVEVPTSGVCGVCGREVA